jgi:hypothetical protein
MRNTMGIRNKNLYGMYHQQYPIVWLGVKLWFSLSVILWKCFNGANDDQRCGLGGTTFSNKHDSQIVGHQKNRQ